jgi:hypothetical protein
MADKQQVIHAFIDALVTRLEADRERATTPDMRSALAKARAAATEVLSTTEYDEAVFRGFGSPAGSESIRASRDEPFAQDVGP